MIQRCFIILSIFILSGCSFLSPAKLHVQNRYLLNRLPCDIPMKKTRRSIVLVSMPVARPIYNTTQMAYTIKPYQVAYFSDNEWAETPAEMLQPLLVQTLQAAHYFKHIVTPPYVGRYNYILNTQLLELLQDFSHGAPCLIMSVRVQIIKMPSERVIATKQFTIAQPFQPANPYGGVFAANYVTAKMLGEIARYSMRVIR